jgi:drug/metabolite transporter (DMT)-like permease
MNANNKNYKYIGIIFVLISGFLWGTMGVFVKYFTARGFSVVDTACVRVGVSAVLLIAYLFVKDKNLLKIKLRDLWCFLGSGLCSLLFFSLCYFEAIMRSSISIAAVLLYIAPVFVMLMSRIFFKDKITPVKLLAVVFSVSGCALVAGIVGNAVRISADAFILGICSAIGYSLYSIFSKFALMRGYNSMTVTAYTFLFAAIGLSFFADVPFVLTHAFNTASISVVSLLIGLISAALPYLFYTKGLERVEAGKASVIASVEPVCATFISVVFYDERLTFLQVLGISAVLFSIVLLEMTPNKN